MCSTVLILSKTKRVSSPCKKGEKMVPIVCYNFVWNMGFFSDNDPTQDCYITTYTMWICLWKVWIHLNLQFKRALKINQMHYFRIQELMTFSDRSFYFSCRYRCNPCFGTTFTPVVMLLKINNAFLNVKSTIG